MNFFVCVILSQNFDRNQSIGKNCRKPFGKRALEMELFNPLTSLSPSLPLPISHFSLFLPFPLSPLSIPLAHKVSHFFHPLSVYLSLSHTHTLKLYSLSLSLSLIQIFVLASKQKFRQKKSFSRAIVHSMQKAALQNIVLKNWKAH